MLCFILQSMIIWREFKAAPKEGRTLNPQNITSTLSKPSKPTKNSLDLAHYTVELLIRRKSTKLPCWAGFCRYAEAFQFGDGNSSPQYAEAGNFFGEWNISPQRNARELQGYHVHSEKLRKQERDDQFARWSQRLPASWRTCRAHGTKWMW